MIRELDKPKQADARLEAALSERALLVDITIRTWGAQTRDPAAAAMLEEHAGAERGMTVVMKVLAPSKAVDRMRAVVKHARRAFEELTLPWSDDGPRLLPAENWLRLHDKMAEEEASFHEEVDRFIELYAEARRAAPRRAGALYDPKNYPSPDQARARFVFRLDYSPVPDVRDIRTALTDEQIERVREAVLRQEGTNLARAMGDVFARLHNAIETMHAQLIDEDATVHRRSFDALERLVEILPALNVTNDPRLIRVHAMLRDSVVAPGRTGIAHATRGRKAAIAATGQAGKLIVKAQKDLEKRII